MVKLGILAAIAMMTSAPAAAITLHCNRRRADNERGQIFELINSWPLELGPIVETSSKSARRARKQLARDNIRANITLYEL